MSLSAFHVLVRIGAAAVAVAAIAGGGMGQIGNPPHAAVFADEPKPAAQGPVSAERINTLVKQLGDKDYYVRQRAQEELARLGFEAFDALSAATADEDLEIASRAKYLLRLMRVQWTVESDSEVVKKLLHDYEFADPRLREAKMQALAGLTNGQGIPALCRLVRFEKSSALSKAAALALLGSQMAAAPPNAVVVETVRKSLDDCKRPGAVWLLTWTRLGGEPDAVLLQWSKLIDHEQELLRRQSSETSPEIVAGLLYALAQAYAERDEKDRAEDTAGRAFQLLPGKQQKELLHHLIVAQHLRGRGQFGWARREFEHVVTQGGDAENVELRIMAQSVLAEMLHDQGQDLDAAETLKKFVEAIDAGKVTPAELDGRKPSEVRSRMYYFFACHWETKGDAAKRRDALDKALAADPGDIDVLIACYRLPEAPPEYHAKIVALVKRAAAANRQLMADDPQDFSPYNQFAWLIGNTEGDFDEALKYSQKSLELKPEEGGFYDTLARVYFAKGDLDNAVKQQTKAAELEPHSGLIRRQLEFFRKQREEKKP